MKYSFFMKYIIFLQSRICWGYLIKIKNINFKKNTSEYLKLQDGIGK